jgi:hypothetical protein
MLDVFYEPDSDKLREEILKLMGFFFLIGVVSGLCMWLQPYFFARSVRGHIQRSRTPRALQRTAAPRVPCIVPVCVGRLDGKCLLADWLVTVD